MSYRVNQKGRDLRDELRWVTVTVLGRLHSLILVLCNPEA